MLLTNSFAYKLLTARGYENVKKVFATAFIAFICSLTLFCACDPFADYTATGLEPKTSVIYDFFEDERDEAALDAAIDKYKGGDSLVLIKSYNEYKVFGIDFGYTEGFFRNNYLLVALAISCSSNGYKFDRVIVKDNCLYPVILKNKIAEGDAVTCDIIYWVYYAEVAAETGCSAGEILYEYR